MKKKHFSTRKNFKGKKKYKTLKKSNAHNHKKYKTKKRSKTGGVSPYDVPRKTSEYDDACGVGWKSVDQETIELVSEQEYLKSEDSTLINKLEKLPEVKSSFNGLITDVKEFIVKLFDINYMFKNGCSPYDFIKMYSDKIHKNKPATSPTLENTRESWITYALYDGRKSSADNGFLPLDQFTKKVIYESNINLSPAEGNVCMQSFFSKMMVPITMIILEYNKLEKNPDGMVLLNMLNIDDIKRRIATIETFSWLSINTLREIYNELNPQKAMQMVLGTSNISEWEPFKGFFGDCHVLGITIWSKGGGPKGQGAGWPLGRINQDTLDCFSVLTPRQKTMFLKQGNDLLFNTFDEDDEINKQIGSIPDWWSKTINTQQINPAEVPGYPQQEESGVYTSKGFFPFTSNNCANDGDGICTISGLTADDINKSLGADENIFYVVIGQNAWKTSKKLQKTTQQKTYTPDGAELFLNKGSGGKALTVNPASLFGLISKWKGKLTVAGPSGTAWLVISSALLFKKYQPVHTITTKPMKQLILGAITSIAAYPHHSIFEVLLAASAPPINAFNFDINATNKKLIEKYLLDIPVNVDIDTSPIPAVGKLQRTTSISPTVFTDSTSLPLPAAISPMRSATAPTLPIGATAYTTPFTDTELTAPSIKINL